MSQKSPWWRESSFIAPVFVALVALVALGAFLAFGQEDGSDGTTPSAPDEQPVVTETPVGSEGMSYGCSSSPVMVFAAPVADDVRNIIQAEPDGEPLEVTGLTFVVCAGSLTQAAVSTMQQNAFDELLDVAIRHHGIPAGEFDGEVWALNVAQVALVEFGLIGGSPEALNTGNPYEVIIETSAGSIFVTQSDDEFVAF